MARIRIVACIAVSLLWGLFSWFMRWGQGYVLLPYLPLNLLVTFAAGLGLSLVLYGSSFEYARRHCIPTMFGYPLRIPSWRVLLIMSFSGLLASCFFPSLLVNCLTCSLITGVLFSALLEELLVHGLFVRYSFTLKEFIIINSLTSLAFALMHLGYYPATSLRTLIALGHIEFSFMLGILTYKTKRIEIPVIIHMLCNFISHTLPVCIIGVDRIYSTSVLLNVCLYLGIMGSGYLRRE